MYQRPRGTRDYLPQDSAKRRKVTEIFRRVFELYGYGEVITPALEYLELLEAKAGPEVREQIYWFEDKAGRRLGLRFELTTSVARVVAERRDLPKPIKFYYIQPVWRYEEPQRGRLREFWHAGIEFMGTKSSAADAEVVAVAARALESAGVDDVVVRVNSRKIAEGLADKYRVEQCRREDFFRILDKLEKTEIASVERVDYREASTLFLLPAVLILSPVVLRAAKDYFRRLDAGEMPRRQA